MDLQNIFYLLAIIFMLLLIVFLLGSLGILFFVWKMLRDIQKRARSTADLLVAELSEDSNLLMRVSKILVSTVFRKLVKRKE